MPEESGGAADRRNIHETQSTDAGVDQLLRHRKHERVSERIRSVDAPQGPRGHSQAVEEAEDNLPEPAKTESVREMQSQRRRHIQGCKLPAGLVSQKCRGCDELCAEPEGARTQNKRPTGSGRSFGVLSRKMYLNFCFDVAPHT